jgi:hypothetical protein
LWQTATSAAPSNGYPLWAEAVSPFLSGVRCRRIGYDRSYVFESRHASRERMIEATTRNIAFIRERLAV